MVKTLVLPAQSVPLLQSVVGVKFPLWGLNTSSCMTYHMAATVYLWQAQFSLLFFGSSLH